jgi:hypothetical protein
MVYYPHQLTASPAPTCATSPPVQVEQRRFMVQPFSMLTSTAAGAEPADSVVAAGAPGGAGDGVDGSSSSRNINKGETGQQQQRRWQRGGGHVSHGAAAASSDERRELVTGPGGVTGQDDLCRRGAHSTQLSSVRPSAGGLRALWPPGSGPSHQPTMLPDSGSGEVCAAELGRRSRRAPVEKQRGRLGRMASRIYALRPRLLRGMCRVV